MAEKMTVERAAELMDQGFHCSQVVMLHAAEVLGLDQELILKMTCGLGGGCFEGSVCGCVSGGICGVGAVYGLCKANDTAQNDIMMAKTAEFKKLFKEKNGSLYCRDLLGGYSFDNPEHAEKLGDDATYANCPKYIVSACEIWDEIAAK